MRLALAEMRPLAEIPTWVFSRKARDARESQSFRRCTEMSRPPGPRLDRFAKFCTYVIHSERGQCTSTVLVPSLGGLQVRFGEGNREGYDLLGFLHTYCIIHGRKAQVREVDSRRYYLHKVYETGDGRRMRRYSTSTSQSRQPLIATRYRPKTTFPPGQASVSPATPPTARSVSVRSATAIL